MPEEVDGLPVAEYCDGDRLADDCEVGWIIRGIFLATGLRPDSMGVALQRADRRLLRRIIIFLQISFTGHLNDY